MQRSLLVDIHTHVYLPRYASLLRKRSVVPRIIQQTTPKGAVDERLLILNHEPSGGRPVGPQVSRSCIWWLINEERKLKGVTYALCD